MVFIFWNQFHGNRSIATSTRPLVHCHHFQDVVEEPDQFLNAADESDKFARFLSDANNRIASAIESIPVSITERILSSHPSLIRFAQFL
jgi:hypothetical protein